MRMNTNTVAKILLGLCNYALIKIKMETLHFSEFEKNSVGPQLMREIQRVIVLRSYQSLS